MINKMAKIHKYQQLNLKNKLSKQEKQRLNHGYREHSDGCQIGVGGGNELRGEDGLRSEGIKKYKQLQNSPADVK